MKIKGKKERSPGHLKKSLLSEHGGYVVNEVLCTLQKKEQKKEHAIKQLHTLLEATPLDVVFALIPLSPLSLLVQACGK